MTGEPYTSYAGCEGPAHFGLEPERIKLYNVQAKERIAAEKAADKKADEALQQLGEFDFSQGHASTFLKLMLTFMFAGSTEQKKEKVKRWWYKFNHRTWGGGF